ncbi:Probable 2-oxoglutarate-dependent dioxygenase AOP1.2 [Linum grandiflorum]
MRSGFVPIPELNHLSLYLSFISMTTVVDIPLINLAGGVAGGDSAEWRELCDKVKEACETHGCFCIKTDEISVELRDKMVKALTQLFDLPEETKQLHVHPKPYRSYLGKNDVVPYLQSFGFDHSAQFDEAKAFSQLMWPNGNPSFNEAVSEMSTKMLELNLLLMKMIFTSFGLDSQLYESYVAESASNIRLMKYKVPPPDAASAGCSGIGLVAHTDKNALTILGHNDVQSLEIQTKDGYNGDQWARVVIPDGAFVAVVGDALKAWSNGRLHAVRHRVMVTGQTKDRYSWGMFLMPKDSVTIEVPEEFVDEEHPLLYRPFNYAAFVSYFVGKLGDNALEVYAGVPPLEIA